MCQKFPQKIFDMILICQQQNYLMKNQTKIIQNFWNLKTGITFNVKCLR